MYESFQKKAVEPFHTTSFTLAIGSVSNSSHEAQGCYRKRLVNGTGPKSNMRLTWKWHWTQEEDELLIKLVKRHGPGNWKYIANHVKGRTGMSCRLRWVNHLNPKVDKTPFSEEEQEKLLQLHRDFGNKWSTIVSFFPGRTDNQLKNQYHALISRNMKHSKLSVKKYQFIDFLGVGNSE